MTLSRLQYLQLDRSDKSQSRLGPLPQPSRTPWKIHPLGTMVPSYSQNATFVGCVFLLLLLVAFAPTAIAQPLQVFILAGQSNMQGHAQVRTF
jgi:hypothetical protein